MKAILFFAFFVLIIVSLSFSQEISLMTYNIRYDNPKDGDNWWQHRKESVRGLLQYYSPNIFGLQEVKHNQLMYLSKELANYSYVGVGRDDGKTKGEYSPIFYQTSIFKMVSQETFWLSPTPQKISIGWDAAMERICTYIQLKHKTTQQIIHVFNAHFDHLGTKARAKSAEVILKKIKQWNTNNAPVILMGDFNSSPEKKPIGIFLTGGLEDKQYKATKGFYGPAGTFNGWETDAKLDTRIDYIFTQKLRVLEYRHIDDKRSGGLWVSDHLPVWAVVIAD